jgi:glycosyltransferase involved in cell wall biosynthesis
MKILIAIATFNRPVITQISLANLASFKSDKVKLVAYDDASSAYTREQLLTYADEVVQFRTNGGIERSRAKAIRDFVYRYSEFDLLYFTDNDTVHDPNLLAVLEGMFIWQKREKVSFPVSVFNTVFHNQPKNILQENEAFFLTKTIPGISQCYSRDMAKIIVDALNNSPDLEFKSGWDYLYPSLLDRPCILTKISYVEHFARDRYEGGMHVQISGNGSEGRKDFERDRAINPTDFLVNIRDTVINEILN